MLRYLVAYVATAIVFFGLDFVWLGTVATGLYKEKLGPLLLERPNFVAAAVFYGVYVVGIILFGEMRAFEGGNWFTAFKWGALFGFFAYATYDMTNYATLKGYSGTVTVVDIAWGTALTGLSSAIGYSIAAAIVRG